MFALFCDCHAGLNSTAAVALTSTLEARLGIALPPTLAFDYPSAQEMAEYLHTLPGLTQTAASPARRTAEPAYVAAAVPMQQAASRAAPPAVPARAVASTRAAASARPAAALGVVQAAVCEVLGLTDATAPEADVPLMAAGKMCALCARTHTHNPCCTSYLAYIPAALKHTHQHYVASLLNLCTCTVCASVCVYG